MTTDTLPIRRALISVSDKTGLIELARDLSAAGIELLSTGGTASALKAAGLKVIDVSEHTGFPEMMDGRLKTLHPKVHGGLLAVRGNAEHDQSAKDHGIAPIDLLIVNLYPFEETLAKGGTYDECVENIDIGGPAMIRAGAKNHAGVTVIVDPTDYETLRAELQSKGGTTLAFRKAMAARALARTAAYDGAISNWLTANPDTTGRPANAFPQSYTVQLTKALDLRYGENPHQSAAFYREIGAPEGSVATARQLGGKELSYNNIADTDAALECVKEFDPAHAACVIVKHANPCGVAVANTIKDAYELAYMTDTESAFGGIIAFNRELDGATAAAIVERQFVEVILAPSVTAEAKDAVSAKKNVRLMVTGAWPLVASSRRDVKTVSGGGLLVQDTDLALYDRLEVVTKRKPTSAEMADLLFAWKVAKFVKSNAIVYAKGGATVGIGAGQMSRVNSSRIAAIKAEMAGLDIKGAAVASDAFFPFADGLLAAAAAGATCVIHPGGSMRDDDVIRAADDAGLAMVLTGMRHFRH